MITLNIPASRTTPAVLYDQEQARFRVVGNSIPENASAFYSPIVVWLKEHGRSMPEGCTFEFSLPYFNSSSLKALYQVMMQIKDLQGQGKQFNIIWFAEEEDDFMLEAGETYREMVGIDITIQFGMLEL